MSPPREPVAIVGSACRFPGGADNPQKLWDLLLQPRDIARRIPADRFAVDGFWHEDGSHHGTSNVAHSYFLDEDPRRFDASFFNINPREAVAMDPQHRLLLETVYESLEFAGWSLQSMRGTSTGVYVGLMCADYYDVQARDPESLPQYNATGTARSILSNRVSYFFDWKGPSLTVDTACSSSLVAVHQAVQALRQGECTAAVAAGANLIFGPEMFISESKLHMLSPTGRSRMWDASADGYARGEGIGVVVLKLLRDAIRDGDAIECVIRETAVNSDGRTNGITMPSAVSQAALIRQTYSRAGLDPSKESDRCQYFEAHGTGTPAGDPIEAEAIKSVFFPRVTGPSETQEEEALFVGSIKTIVGHTEGTAGIAGLLKASLALQNRIIPPNMHFDRLNPRILPFYDDLQVPVTPKVWPEGGERRASVNSFGFGGTNAHCILEGYDPSLHSGRNVCQSGQMHCSPKLEDDLKLLPFSAYSERSLSLLIDAIIAYLESHPSTELGSFAHTLRRRSIFPIREYVIGFSRDQILEQLIGLKAGPKRNEGSLSGSRTLQAGDAGRILGVFTGQGAQWPTMGRDLISKSQVFSSSIDHLDDALRKLPDPPSWSLRQQLQADKHESRCNEAAFSQPLCTAIQVALVDLLWSIGIHFSVIVGHSSGEIAAAYAAGCLSAEAAIMIAYYRGLYSKKSDSGAEPVLSMMAVGISFSEARKICSRAEYSNRIFAAASNAPFSATISGEKAVLETVLEELQEKRLFARMLHVNRAYHSPFMESCVQPYLDSLQKCNIKYTSAQSQCIWVSSVHGFEMDSSSDQVDNNYWVENLLQPVLFSDALEQAIRDHGPFDAGIEVGPHAALAGPIAQTLKALNQSPVPYYGTLKRGEKDVVAFGTCVGNLWTTLGSSVNLSKLQTAINGTVSDSFHLLKDLPTYPWDHEVTYWKETRLSKEYRGRQQPHELLGPCIERTGHQMRWRNVLHPHEIPWLQGHKLQNDILFPAAGYCVMAVEAALGSWGQELQLIELHDLDIRRGINLDEGSPGIEVISYLSWDAYENVRSSNANMADMRFSCCAGKIDGTDPLSVRFTAGIRAQLGSPDVSLFPRRTEVSSEMSAVDIDRFYMTTVGLEYTGLFRGLRSAERRMFQASARVTRLESPLLIHPASLDSCFQALFVAFTAPGDESIRTAFIPRRAKTVRLNPHVLHGAFRKDQLLYVEAYITDFRPPTQDSSSYFTGDIEIYNQDGTCLIQIEGFKCVALADYSKEHDRNIFHTTAWDQDISFDMVVSDYTLPNDSCLLSLAECERLARSYFHINGCITPTSETAVIEDLDGFEASDSSTPGIKLIQAARNASLVSDAAPHLQFITARDQYLQSSFWVCRIRDYVARTVKQIGHKFPRMKILELFAGNGVTTELVLDSLGDAFASYLLTDPSTEVLQAAQAGLESRNDRLQYMTLDIANMSPEEFGTHTYDLIIANTFPCSFQTTCLSLENARQLLKPGGILLLAGVTGMSLFGCFVRDHVHDLVSTEEEVAESVVRSERDWDIVLEDCGFTGVDSIAYDTTEQSTHIHSLIISRAQGAPFETVYRPLEVVSMAPLEEDILIIGGNSFLGARIIGEIQCHLSAWSNHITYALSVDDIFRGGLRVPAYVLNLEELDEPIFKDMNPVKFRALQNLFQQSKNIFWVTEGYKQADAYSAMTLGLGRVVSTESPSLNLSFLDVDCPKVLASSILAILFAQFVQGAEADVDENDILWAQEREMAIENGRVYIPRVVHAKEMNDRFNSRFRPITKGLPLGISSAQQMIQSHSLEGRDSSIAVKVIACSSMAFRIYDGTCFYLCIGMMEQEGHESMTLAFTSSQDRLITATNHLMLESTIDEESVPNTLKLLAALLVSSRVQEYAKYGTTVIFTNDPVLAKVILLSLKDRRQLLKLVTSDKALANLNDSTIYLHPHTPLRTLRLLLPKDISLFINLDPDSRSLRDRLFEAIPETCATVDSQCYFSHRPTPVSNFLGKTIPTIAVLESLWGDYLASKQALEKSIDTQSFEAATVCAVEHFTETRIEYQVERLDPKELLRSDATYFLVGMTGELGESLCRWMVSNNVRHIAIASRSPKPALWHQELKAQGCQLMVLSLDVCSTSELHATHDQITRSMPPIVGVVNGAMVLADSAFFNMTFEDFVRVLEPKVDGSSKLDELFSDADLDFFIMLSSTASLIGNAGQSNYSAANMYMKAIAEQRRQRGLAGSCVDIGMILGLGVVSREKTHEEPLRRAGLMAIAEPDFHCIFTEAIRVGQTTSAESPCFSTGLHVPPGQLRPQWYRDPRFAHFQVTEDFDPTANRMSVKVSLQEQIESISNLALANSVIQEAFITMLQGLLQLSAPIDPARPLVELGIDSLLGTEIRSWLYKELNFQVSILKILGGISLLNLCREAAEYAFSKLVSVPKAIEEIVEQPLDREPETSSVNGNNRAVSDTLSYISRHQDASTAETTSFTSYTIEPNVPVTPRTPDAVPIALGHRIDSSIERTEPLSIEQEKIWFMLSSIDDPTMYNCTIKYQVHGYLDMSRLKSAVTTVARRHESLRTAFITGPSDGIPNQTILKDPRIIWTEFNSADLLDVPREFFNHQNRVFNLVEGEIMAVSVMPQSEDWHIVIFSYHHLAMDGVSWQLVLREFGAAYKDPKSLPPVAAQYATFANEQRRSTQLLNNKKGKACEDRRSKEIPTSLPLFPFAKSSFRKIQKAYEMTRKHYRLDEDTSNKIRQASSHLGTTAFQFHLAAIQLFLLKILQVDRFCIGIANANRDESRFEQVVGLMVEILPLIFEPRKNQTFSSLAQETRSRVLEALSHSTGASQMLMSSHNYNSGNDVHSPLYQVMVNYIAGVTHDVAFDNAIVRYCASDDARQPQDLVITILEDIDGTTLLSFRAQDYLYDGADIQLLLSLYARLIQSLSKDQESQLVDYSVFGSSELASEQYLGNGPELEGPWPDSLPRRISSVAERHPQSLALKDQYGKGLTYAAMEFRIQSITALLAEIDAKPGDYIVVACGPSVDTVCSLIAIWRMGAVYVPVDLDHGVDRLAVIVSDCRPSVILCKDARAIQFLRHEGNLEIVELDDELPVRKPVSVCNVSVQDTAVLLYTSGTTGVPKGVQLSHDNLRCHIQAVEQEFGFGRQVVLQQSSHNFDASLFQMLTSLVHGGTLIMTSSRNDPLELAYLMLNEAVTLTLAVPSEYALWMSEAGQILEKCSSWRYAFSGGEKMSYATTQAFAGLGLSDLTLVNAYGPCEISIACAMGIIQYQQIHSDADSIHAGRPLPSYNLIILDEQLRPLPAGWPGEICIGGPAVSNGYLNRDCETKSQFVELDGLRLYRSGDYGRILSGGNLECRGRISGDSQIKLRGMRIELDEVSNAIIQSSKGALTDAATIAKGNGESQYLAAFIAFAHANRPADIDGFIKTLLGALPLPVYARPAIIVPIEQIPLTESGKVDRRALDQLPTQRSLHRSADVAGLGIIEVKLKELWEDFLPVPGTLITRKANFFELGGNSLHLLKLQARIRQITNTKIPITSLFRASTFEEMAILIGITTSARQAETSIDWDAETAIPQKFVLPKPKDPPAGVKEIILTGATGFFGKVLLGQLVKNPLVERIHCIAVRPNADGSSRKLEIQSPKIRLYSGDLSHTTLGLSAKDISSLVANVDCIIHNGADVSFLKPYTSLRAANVLSTKFLFEICMPRRIPFHYISTAGITSLSQENMFPEQSLSKFPPASDAASALTEGYSASKWASEVFLEKANAKFGIAVYIHRPSNITGPEVPTTNVIETVLALSRKMQVIPATDLWEGYFDFISEQQAAEKVISSVFRATTDEVAGVRFSHVCGETRFNVREFKEHMENMEGVAFQQLPWKEWVDRAGSSGLDPMVSAYLENFDNGERKVLLPWLLHSGEHDS